jgi:hypothetical protein
VKFADRTPPSSQCDHSRIPAPRVARSSPAPNASRPAGPPSPRAPDRAESRPMIFRTEQQECRIAASRNASLPAPAGMGCPGVQRRGCDDEPKSASGSRNPTRCTCLLIRQMRRASALRSARMPPIPGDPLATLRRTSGTDRRPEHGDDHGERLRGQRRGH